MSGEGFHARNELSASRRLLNDDGGCSDDRGREHEAIGVKLARVNDLDGPKALHRLPHHEPGDIRISAAASAEEGGPDDHVIEVVQREFAHSLHLSQFEGRTQYRAFEL